MTKVLYSNKIAENLIEEMKNTVNTIATLAIIKFGNDFADTAYENGLKKNALKTDIAIKVYQLDIKESQQKVLELIDNLNNDKKINGILIFRPLPKHLDEYAIDMKISPEKDIDCMNPNNKAKVYEGNISGFIPQAPKASILLLEEYGYNLCKKHCVIINHSEVVGKPLAMMLLKKWATVTICHEKTENLKLHTLMADYVFTATGKAEMIDSSYLKETSVVIDIGLSKNSNGHLSGDLNVKDIDGKIEAYSPAVSGVGELTNLLLLNNVIKAAVEQKR